MWRLKSKRRIQDLSRFDEKTRRFHFFSVYDLIIHGKYLYILNCLFLNARNDYKTSSFNPSLVKGTGSSVVW